MMIVMDDEDIIGDGIGAFGLLNIHITVGLTGSKE